MTDRWRCVAVITLSALRVLPGSCKRTLLSMALNPHRDNESAVTCMTTSSPGTAEDGENCSETWHRDHTVDGVKIIWCFFAVLAVCDGTQGRNVKDTIAAGRPGRVLPCSWNSISIYLFYLYSFYSNRFDLIFFCFLFLKKKPGGRCLPLWYWEVVPDVLLLRTNQSDLKGLLWKVKRVVFSKHTLYIQYFRLSHHQRAHKENWKEHLEGFGFD